MEPSRVVSLAPAYVWESNPLGPLLITVIGEKGRKGNLSVLEGRGVCDMVICEDVGGRGISLQLERSSMRVSLVRLRLATKRKASPAAAEIHQGRGQADRISVLLPATCQ